MLVPVEACPLRSIAVLGCFAQSFQDRLRICIQSRYSKNSYSAPEMKLGLVGMAVFVHVDDGEGSAILQDRKNTRGEKTLGGSAMKLILRLRAQSASVMKCRALLEGTLFIIPRSACRTERTTARRSCSESKDRSDLPVRVSRRGTAPQKIAVTGAMIRSHRCSSANSYVQSFGPHRSPFAKRETDAMVA